ncbi:hypothetical protein ACI3KS_02245 [Microbacterium sp. ZW T5_45]|uniref:hypothetical protein n=1 Tax=Microbacterium sp. ZW T5_45 TaxID=3378080 RepID=UPI003852E711
MELRTRRALALIGSAAVLSLALTGCSVLDGILGSGSGDAQRDEDGNVTESANVGIFSVDVGDCMLETSTGLLQDADLVPCDQPHDQEVFYEITLPDGEFSADDVDAAGQECVGDPFTSFVGIGYQESVLEVTTISPTQQTWDEFNDRVVQCVVVDPAGSVSTSLAGAAR